MALAPRIWFLDTGLPHYLIDENDVVEPAVTVLGGNFSQWSSPYGPLYADMLASLYWIDAVLAGKSVADYSIDIFFDPSRYYILARAFNVALDLTAAVLTYFLGQLVFGRRTALLMLPLLLFPFADVLTTFSIRVDSLLAVLAAITLLAAIKAYDTYQPGWYLVAGVAVGLSLATKFLPALLILPTLALTHLGIEWRKSAVPDPAPRFDFARLQRALFRAIAAPGLWLAALAAVICYSSLNLSVFFHLRQIYWRSVRFIATQRTMDQPAGFDVTRYFDDFGHVFVIGGILGMAYVLGYALYRRDFRAAILWSYPAVFFLAFASGSAREYWFVPIIYLIVLFLAKLIGDVGTIFSGRAGRWFITLSLVLVLAEPTMILVNAMTAGREGAPSYPSLAGRHWIESNLPPDSRVLMYGAPAYLPRIVDRRPEVQAFIGEYLEAGRNADQRFAGLYENAHAAYLKTGRPTYLVTSIPSKCKKDSELVRRLKTERFDLLVTHCDPAGLVDGEGPAIRFPTRARRFSHPVWIIRSPRAANESGQNSDAPGRRFMPTGGVMPVSPDSQARPAQICGKYGADACKPTREPCDNAASSPRGASPEATAAARNPS